MRTKEKDLFDKIERIVQWKEGLALIHPCYYKAESNLQMWTGVLYYTGTFRSEGKS